LGKIRGRVRLVKIFKELFCLYLMKAKEIILIGGGDYRKQENEEIDNYLRKIISPDMKILIVPFATTKDKYVSWASSLFNNFGRYGLRNFEILDEDLEKEKIIQRINSSDVLFFTGGLPNIFMEKVIEKDIIGTIKEFEGILIGYSAGSIVLSKECIVLSEEGHPNEEIIDGIGLVDFSNYVHYKKDQDSSLIRFSKNRKIFAIGNKSAISVREKERLFIGDIYLFENCIKKKIT
jgi:dipeptidase E